MPMSQDNCRVMVWKQDDQFLAVCPRFNLVRYSENPDAAVRAIEAAILARGMDTDPAANQEDFSDDDLSILRRTNGGPQMIRTIELSD